MKAPYISNGFEMSDCLFTIPLNSLPFKTTAIIYPHKVEAQDTSAHLPPGLPQEWIRGHEEDISAP